MTRLLDCGCADASVSLWAAQQTKGPVTVDGIDLDPQHVRTASERAAGLGIAGTFKTGSALDAPDLFEPGSYDTVVAFELIEHAPDVDALLSALEAMCKPDGVVMISTPDGVFGEGSNQHHLRVYRASDLADELRRRGTLLNMAVGSDGVTVAAYRPGQKREDVAIYTGPSWAPWSPRDIETKGLGGSETAAVRLAHELSELGYVVTVYGDCEQCAVREVIYRHYSTFDQLEPRGVLISSRIPDVFTRRVASRVNLLWTHDIDFGEALLPTHGHRIDAILALSKPHAQHLRGRYPWASKKLATIRNGIQTDYFTPKAWEDRQPRLLYTSSPDRGLDLLLELWPRIREQAPDAIFSFCYADVYDRMARLNPPLAEFRARCAELATQPGCEPLGSLSQPVLAELMCDSRVWAHPSYVTMQDQVFLETSCIGALEAQAAGALVVASNWGALSETVRKGRLIDGPALSEKWKDAFVSEIVSGLTDPEVGKWAVENGPVAVKDQGWDGVARDVHQLIGRIDAKAAK